MIGYCPEPRDDKTLDLRPSHTFSPRIQLMPQAVARDLFLYFLRALVTLRFAIPHAPGLPAVVSARFRYLRGFMC